MIEQTEYFPHSFLGSVVAIVVGFLAIVLILFGGAYYFKIRWVKFFYLLIPSFSARAFLGRIPQSWSFLYYCILRNMKILNIFHYYISL